MCDLYSPAPCNAFFGTAASASAQDGGEWISVSVSYDYVATLYCLGSSMLDIHLAPSSNMAPGTYTGNVSSGAAEAQQPPENTPVTMRLASQTLAVPSPSQIGVALMQGGPALTYPFVPGISLSPMGAIPATSVVASGAGLSASVSGGNVIVTADPGSLATGAHNGLLTIGCAADNCPVEVPVTLTVASPGPPGIYGVFDNITFAPQAAPGDVAVVLGEQLSTEPPVLATSVPLPTSLGGASVQVGGVAAPLYYSSPNQIAFQVPSGTAPGPGVMVQVQRAGEISGGFSVPVRYLDAQIAAVTDTAYSLLDAYHPAHAGGAIILWVIGLGPTVPPVPDGAAAPVSPLAKAVDSPVVQFGPNVTVNADFAGLSPGWVGLYQVNVTVPADMPSGNFSVKLAYPGPSNTVPLGIE